MTRFGAIGWFLVYFLNAVLALPFAVTEGNLLFWLAFGANVCLAAVWLNFLRVAR